jgi:hypothetical protein
MPDCLALCLPEQHQPCCQRQNLLPKTALQVAQPVQVAEPSKLEVLPHLAVAWTL